MSLVPVSTILADANLREPVLHALVPDHKTYKTLLIQPLGIIEADTKGVRNQDRELADKQFGRFLFDAVQTGADLVITPEYSMPWGTLVKAVKEGTVPQASKLWALGCESIQYSALQTLKQELAPDVELLFENLEPDDDLFVDPLVYVFVASCSGGPPKEKLVLLVQFKTYPMADEDQFEINSLQCGTRLYQFGGWADSDANGNVIKLVSMICSDALDFVNCPNFDSLRTRTLFLHIQLNRDPRNYIFGQYRNRLFGTKDKTTEIICLNWSRHIRLYVDSKWTIWNNIGGSAWYIRADDFDSRDQTLIRSHRRGLYYTWLAPLYSHALYFNYEPAMYLLIATKALHLNVPAPLDRRVGPKLTSIKVWDPAVHDWVLRDDAEDGFEGVAAARGGATATALIDMAQENPLNAERILALSTGEITPSNDWYLVGRLDSCRVDANEFIGRMTFCQDPNRDSFRDTRIRRFSRLWDLLQDANNLPPALRVLNGDLKLTWMPSFPHQNLLSTNGERATVIYVGEDKDLTQVSEIELKAAAVIHRSYTDPHSSHTARQRLFVWYRDDNGNLALYNRQPGVAIDDPGGESPISFGRPEQC